MQKSNILLERRVIKEQEEVGEGFLSRLFNLLEQLLNDRFSIAKFYFPHPSPEVVFSVHQWCLWMYPIISLV